MVVCRTNVQVSEWECFTNNYKLGLYYKINLKYIWKCVNGDILHNM